MWNNLSRAHLFADAIAPEQLKVFVNFYIEVLWDDVTREAIRLHPREQMRSLPWNISWLSPHHISKWFPVTIFPQGPSANGFVRLALKWKTSYNLLFLECFHNSKFWVQKIDNYGLSILSRNTEGFEIVSMDDDIVPRIKGINNLIKEYKLQKIIVFFLSYYNYE